MDKSQIDKRSSHESRSPGSFILINRIVDIDEAVEHNGFSSDVRVSIHFFFCKRKVVMSEHKVEKNSRNSSSFVAEVNYFLQPEIHHLPFLSNNSSLLYKSLSQRKSTSSRFLSSKEALELPPVNTFIAYFCHLHLLAYS